jgi:flavorubredoxin
MHAASLQAISRGLTKAGVAVETLNLELCTVDDVTRAVGQAAGFVLGTLPVRGHCLLLWHQRANFAAVM